MSAEQHIGEIGGSAVLRPPAHDNAGRATYNIAVYNIGRGMSCPERGEAAVGHIRQQAAEGDSAAAPAGTLRDGASRGTKPGAQRAVVQQCGERVGPGPHVRAQLREYRSGKPRPGQRLIKLRDGGPRAGDRQRPAALAPGACAAAGNAPGPA